MKLLNTVPVATIVHLIVTCVLSADLLTDGSLSADATAYAGIVLGGNGLVAIGRGIAARKD